MALCGHHHMPSIVAALIFATVVRSQTMPHDRIKNDTDEFHSKNFSQTVNDVATGSLDRNATSSDPLLNSSSENQSSPESPAANGPQNFSTSTESLLNVTDTWIHPLAPFLLMENITEGSNASQSQISPNGFITSNVSNINMTIDSNDTNSKVAVGSPFDSMLSNSSFPESAKVSWSFLAVASPFSTEERFNSSALHRSSEFNFTSMPTNEIENFSTPENTVIVNLTESATESSNTSIGNKLRNMTTSPSSEDSGNVGENAEVILTPLNRTSLLVASSAGALTPAQLHLTVGADHHQYDQNLTLPLSNGTESLPLPSLSESSNVSNQTNQTIHDAMAIGTTQEAPMLVDLLPVVDEANASKTAEDSEKITSLVQSQNSTSEETGISSSTAASNDTSPSEDSQGLTTTDSTFTSVSYTSNINSTEVATSLPVASSDLAPLIFNETSSSSISPHTTLTVGTSTPMPSVSTSGAIGESEVTIPAIPTNSSDFEPSELDNITSDFNSTNRFFNMLNHLEALNTFPPEWFHTATTPVSTTKFVVFNLFPTGLENDSVLPANFTNENHPFALENVTAIERNSTTVPDLPGSNFLSKISFINSTSADWFATTSPSANATESANHTTIEFATGNETQDQVDLPIPPVNSTEGSEDTKEILISTIPPEWQTPNGTDFSSNTSTVRLNFYPNVTLHTVTESTESPNQVSNSTTASFDHGSTRITYNSTKLKFFNQLNHLEILNNTIPPEWFRNATSTSSNNTTKLIIFNLFPENKTGNASQETKPVTAAQVKETVAVIFPLQPANDSIRINGTGSEHSGAVSSKLQISSELQIERPVTNVSDHLPHIDGSNNLTQQPTLSTITSTMEPTVINYTATNSTHLTASPKMHQESVGTTTPTSANANMTASSTAINRNPTNATASSSTVGPPAEFTTTIIHVPQPTTEAPIILSAFTSARPNISVQETRMMTTTASVPLNVSIHPDLLDFNSTLAPANAGNFSVTFQPLPLTESTTEAPLIVTASQVPKESVKGAAVTTFTTEPDLRHSENDLNHLSDLQLNNSLTASTNNSVENASSVALFNELTNATHPELLASSSAKVEDKPDTTRTINFTSPIVVDSPVRNEFTMNTSTSPASAVQMLTTKELHFTVSTYTTILPDSATQITSTPSIVTSSHAPYLTEVVEMDKPETVKDILPLEYHVMSNLTNTVRAEPASSSTTSPFSATTELSFPDHHNMSGNTSTLSLAHNTSMVGLDSQNQTSGKEKFVAFGIKTATISNAINTNTGLFNLSAITTPPLESTTERPQTSTHTEIISDIRKSENASQVLISGNVITDLTTETTTTSLLKRSRSANLETTTLPSTATPTTSSTEAKDISSSAGVNATNSDSTSTENFTPSPTVEMNNQAGNSTSSTVQPQTTSNTAITMSSEGSTTSAISSDSTGTLSGAKDVAITSDDHALWSLPSSDDSTDYAPRRLAIRNGFDSQLQILSVPTIKALIRKQSSSTLPRTAATVIPNNETEAKQIAEDDRKFLSLIPRPLNAGQVMKLILNPGRVAQYPTYERPPQTSFSCKNVSQPGYYADADTGCQEYHRCDISGSHYKFICPKTTLFSQITLVCDYWYNVNCNEQIKYADFVNSRLYHGITYNRNWYKLREASGTATPVTTGTTVSSTTLSPISAEPNARLMIIPGQFRSTTDTTRSSTNVAVSLNPSTVHPTLTSPTTRSPVTDSNIEMTTATHRSSDAPVDPATFGNQNIATLSGPLSNFTAGIEEP